MDLKNSLIRYRRRVLNQEPSPDVLADLAEKEARKVETTIDLKRLFQKYLRSQSKKLRKRCDLKIVAAKIERPKEEENTEVDEGDLEEVSDSQEVDVSVEEESFESLAIYGRTPIKWRRKRSLSRKDTAENCDEDSSLICTPAEKRWE